MGLSVKKETTLANTLAIFYVAFMDFAPAGFYNAQMTFLLESPDHFNIPRDQIGRANSIMLFSVYVCCILFQPFNGYIYELFGRRAPLTLCPFGTALLMSILPQTAPYFSLCVIVRSLLSYFNGFLVTSPLIADYIKNESRG